MSTTPTILRDKKSNRLDYCACGSIKQERSITCRPCLYIKQNKNPRKADGSYSRKKGACIDCNAQLSDTYRLYCGTCSHKLEKNHKWKGGVSKMQGYSSINENNRRAQKAKSVNHFTIQEWNDLKEAYGNMCLCCKQTEPIIKLTKDHIVPLSRGGDNSINNIQPLCKPCNSRKYNKTINYMANEKDI